jgi:DNA-binding CsgD family transcriptional regulator
MLTGEAGVGKTAMCEELRRIASGRGFHVAGGGCHDGDDAPYGPFVALIEQLYRGLPAATFIDVLGAAADDLARFMPELRRWVPAISAPPAVPAEHERRLVFAAMTDVIHRLGAIAPVLLLLEDLHWADTTSLLLLSHLASRLTRTSTLVVVTFRPDEARASTSLGRAAEQWRRSGATEHVELRGLVHREVGDMLAALAGTPPPRSVVDRWHELTGGNPFFIAEVFRHLRTEGLLTDPEEGAWRGLAEGAELPVPPSIRLVTEMRVRVLSLPAQRVLEALAVAGHACVESIAEALSTMTGAVVDALDEAHRAALVVSGAALDGIEYHFAHELIRLAVLAGIEPQRQQLLHAATARAIETTAPDRLGIRAAELVHHLCRAGTSADRERLLIHLDAAVAHATGAAAFEDALGHLETALGLVGPDDERWVPLLVRRARALCGLGRWDEAEAAWQKSVHLLGQADLVEAIGPLCAEAAGNLFWAGRYDQCMTAVATGLAALGDQLSVDRVRLLALGGRCATFAGDHRAGEELTGEALVVAEAVDDRTARAVAAFARTVHHWSLVEPAEAVRHGRAGAADARAGGALWELADGLGFSQLAHVLTGEVDAVAAIGTEIDTLVERLGHYGAAFVRGRGRVLYEITRGDLDAISAAAHGDLDQCRALGLPWAADSYAWLGLTAFWRGDWDHAGELFGLGLAEDPTGTLSGACWATAFLLRAYQGDRHGCDQMLRAASGRFPTVGEPSGLGNWTSLLAAAEGLALLGRADDAARHYPAIMRAISAGNVLRGYDNRLVESVAGLAADAAGDPDRADAHFRRALRQAETMPHRIEQPETRRLYAWTLIGRGDPAGRALAVDLLDEAIQSYRSIGMPRHEELARALRLQALSAAPGAVPGGLTAREREVLIKLAAGQTSKEIARGLSISVATVSRHTANVYSKIDARNRTEATRWALRHGLVATGPEPTT